MKESIQDASPKKKRKIELSAEDILAWADKMSGRTVKSTSEALNETTRMVFLRRSKVQRFIEAGGFDLNQYRLPMFGLYSEAVKSLYELLKAKNPQATLFFFEKMGIMPGNTDWIDKIADAIKNSGTLVNVGVVSGAPAVDLSALPESERNGVRNNALSVYANETARRF
jgi:hypothetical protein